MYRTHPKMVNYSFKNRSKIEGIAGTKSKYCCITDTEGLFEQLQLRLTDWLTKCRTSPPFPARLGDTERASGWQEMKVMILTLSGQLAAGCVKCAHGAQRQRSSSHGHIAWWHHMPPFCRGAATLLNIPPKIHCFLRQLASILGDSHTDGDVSLSDMGATFSVLVSDAASRPLCCVTADFSGVTASITSPPTGHKYGVYPTARSDYSDAYISRVT